MMNQLGYLGILGLIIRSVLPGGIIPPEPQQEVIEATPPVEVVKVEKPKPVKKKKKTYTVAENPRNCNLHTQWMWPDGSCHDKTIVRATQPVSEAVSGDWVAQCKAWAKQAGVPLNSWALELIKRESHCNPNAQNPVSTAYGIGQFLNSTWAGVGCVRTTNPVTQLSCMWKYVQNRHGSWQGAVAFHDRNNWY